MNETERELVDAAMDIPFVKIPYGRFPNGKMKRLIEAVQKLKEERNGSTT